MLPPIMSILTVTQKTSVNAGINPAVNSVYYAFANAGSNHAIVM